MVYSIDKKDKPWLDFRREVKELPNIKDLDKTQGWIFDVRGTDLSSFDLREQTELLCCMDFDDRTIFPSQERMPNDFDPQEVLERGKNPGLGMRSLQNKGYTGKGVTVAIVDQPMTLGHRETDGKIIHYEEIGYKDIPCQMHGVAVSSILAGSTVGVAPDVKIAYFAANTRDTNNPQKTTNQHHIKALEKIYDMNKQLPKKNRIKIISISWGFNKEAPGFDEIINMAKKLRKQDCFMICTRPEANLGLAISGLYRDPQKDPEDRSSYELGMWQRTFWKGEIPKQYLSTKGKAILAPMDHRTTASPTGKDDYVHYASGGWSLVVPYLAGMYAIAKQVDKHITPEHFWKTLENTGSEIIYKEASFGIMVNPENTIGKIEKDKLLSTTIIKPKVRE